MSWNKSLSGICSKYQLGDKTYRFQEYSEDSKAYSKGVLGRWQVFGESGNWVNCERPEMLNIDKDKKVFQWTDRTEAPPTEGFMDYLKLLGRV